MEVRKSGFLWAIPLILIVVLLLALSDDFRVGKIRGRRLFAGWDTDPDEQRFGRKVVGCGDRVADPHHRRP
jgi:hypothetical protein